VFEVGLRVVLVDDPSGLDRHWIVAEDSQDGVDAAEEAGRRLPEPLFILIVLGLEDAGQRSMARNTSSWSSGTST